MAKVVQQCASGGQPAPGGEGGGVVPLQQAAAVERDAGEERGDAVAWTDEATDGGRRLEVGGRGEDRDLVHRQRDHRDGPFVVGVTA